jgi:hypothetical protein
VFVLCENIFIYNQLHMFVFVVKGPTADATDAPQPWGLLCSPVMKIISFFVFLCKWSADGMKLTGKPKYSGKKPVPMPLRPPQIPHGLTRDRTRASAVRGRHVCWFTQIWTLVWNISANNNNNNNNYYNNNKTVLTQTVDTKEAFDAKTCIHTVISCTWRVTNCEYQCLILNSC